MMEVYVARKALKTLARQSTTRIDLRMSALAVMASTTWAHYLVPADIVHGLTEFTPTTKA